MNPYSAYGLNPGSVQLGMQTPASQLTPEQLAELQRIRGLSDQQSFTGGVDLEGATAPGLRQRLSQGVKKGVETAGKAKGAAQEAAQAFLARYPNAGKYGIAAIGAASLVPGVTTALSELEEGRPAGAAGALVPGLLSAGGTALAMAPHPLAKAAGFGLMGLGAVLPGAAAKGTEAIRQEVTGKPTKGREGEFGTQMAMREQMLQQDLSALDRTLGVNLGYIRDLAKDMSNQQYLDLQRNIPLINQLKNADLVRQQALINTQGQNYAMLGVLSTAGQLATGGQRETGATLRTALTANPYSGSTLQAPQISF